jgi:integrase
VLHDTGCRPHEAYNVTAKHLDREEKCIRYSRGKGNKPRVVPLTDRAFDILSKLADRHPEGLLLRNGHGGKWSSSVVSGRFNVLKKRTGIKMTAKGFRHAFITRKCKEGLNPVVLMNITGHKSLRMISEVYAHLGGDIASLRASL